MNFSPNIEAVRICIDNAVRLPPMLEPWSPPEPIASAEPLNLPRHLTQSFAARLPIGFCGMGEAAAGERLMQWGVAELLYLYRDYNRLPRALDLAGHDRDGIASLFAGDDRLLARLWPGRRGWDAQSAAETLVVEGGRRPGLVHGDGFALHAEPPDLRRAHSAVSRLARRLLWRGLDPYQVVDLARGWNRTRGHGALSSEIVEQIVDAACGRELIEEDRRHAG